MKLDYTNIKAMPSVIGAGLLCLDIIVREGSTHYLNGGSCGNIVSALSFLGWNSSVITRKYRDMAGNIVRTNLSKIGVSKIEVGSQIVETPRIIENIETRNEGQRHQFLFNCPVCGKELPRIKPLDKKSVIDIPINNNDFNVFYSDRTSPGISILRQNFRNEGSWTVYEPNSCRNKDSFFINSLESHIVKFSSEQIPKSFAEQLRLVSTKGSTLLIIRTLGEEGLDFCYRKRNNEMSTWIHLNAQPVLEFVDAAGAGDWCTAGLLFSLINTYPKSRKWLSRDDVVGALQYGQALSAISCLFVGAQGLIYSSDNEKVKELLETANRQEYGGLKPAEVHQSSGYCYHCLLPSIH